MLHTTHFLFFCTLPNSSSATLFAGHLGKFSIFLQNLHWALYTSPHALPHRTCARAPIPRHCTSLLIHLTSNQPTISYWLKFPTYSGFAINGIFLVPVNYRWGALASATKTDHNVTATQEASPMF